MTVTDTDASTKYVSPDAINATPQAINSATSPYAVDPTA